MPTPFRPRLTPLDDRTTPAVINWIYTGAGVGYGGTPANWEGGVVPGAGDTARFSVSFGDGDADLTNLTALAALDIHEGVDVTVGDLTVGTLYSNPGAATALATVTIEDALTVTGGTSEARWTNFLSGDAGAMLKMTGGTHTLRDAKVAVLALASDSVVKFLGDVGLYRAFDLASGADLRLDSGVHVSDWNAGVVNATDGSFVRHSVAAGPRVEVDVPVYVDADSFLVSQSPWAAGASRGIRFDGGLSCLGHFGISGGNHVLVEGTALLRGTLTVSPLSGDGVFSPAEMSGDWACDQLSVGFAVDPNDIGFTDLYVWGDVSFTDTTYAMNGHWSTETHCMNVLHVGGTLTLDNSAFAYDELGLPIQFPPTTTGELHPVIADDIVGDFATYDIPSRYDHEIHASGVNRQVVCLFWTATSWPSQRTED